MAEGVRSILYSETNHQVIDLAIADPRASYLYRRNKQQRALVRLRAFCLCLLARGWLVELLMAALVAHDLMRSSLRSSNSTSSGLFTLGRLHTRHTSPGAAIWASGQVTGFSR